MAALDLTNDFNATSSFFSWLLRLFTGSPSTGGTGAQSGDSLFSGFENFMKYLFSGFSTSPAPSPNAGAPGSRPASAGAGQNNQPPARTFMGRVRDDFTSVTNAVTNKVSQLYHGAAFDVSKAVSTLKSECGSSPGGHCLANVEDALTAAGLRFGNNSKINDVMPVRNGSHWAKDLAPVLANDSRFQEVSSGYGASFSSSYTPKVGDIAVWSGSTYGHTQMFTGYDSQGKPVWISDFKTSPGNWTGLAKPDSHGQFTIFRQKSADDTTLLANNQPAPATASPRLS